HAVPERLSGVEPADATAELVGVELVEGDEAPARGEQGGVGAGLKVVWEAAQRASDGLARRVKEELAVLAGEEHQIDIIHAFARVHGGAELVRIEKGSPRTSGCPWMV